MSDNVRFNKYKNQLISLGEGEQFCKKCGGRGVVPNRSKHRIPILTTKYVNLTCSVCFGDGKLDWVEQATGKPKTTTMEDQNDSYTPPSR